MLAQPNGRLWTIFTASKARERSLEFIIKSAKLHLLSPIKPSKYPGRRLVYGKLRCGQKVASVDEFLSLYLWWLYLQEPHLKFYPQIQLIAFFQINCLATVKGAAIFCSMLRVSKIDGQWYRKRRSSGMTEPSFPSCGKLASYYNPHVCQTGWV